MAKGGEGTPDAVLVVRAILGDLDAFGELASRYRAAVVRVARSIVEREDAEDVAQDAFLLAFKALPSIEDPEKFAAWLSVITRHRAQRSLMRERAYRAGRVEFDEMLLDHVGALARPMLDEKLDVSGNHSELNRALENIPADYALVLRLRYLDDMPLKRVSAFLGVPLSTVKWRLHRGKKLLREQVELLRKGDDLWKERKRLPS